MGIFCLPQKLTCFAVVFSTSLETCKYTVETPILTLDNGICLPVGS